MSEELGPTREDVFREALQDIARLRVWGDVEAITAKTARSLVKRMEQIAMTALSS